MAEVSSIEHDVTRQLDNLSPYLQRQVLAFAQALAQSFPKGVAGKKLLRFSGILEADDIQAITQANEAECERVDVNEW
jgi:hypothetical protein